VLFKRKEEKMGEILKNFLKGYSKSLEILPNFEQNNQSNDWISIGYDIENSLKKYKRVKNAKKSPAEKNRLLEELKDHPEIIDELLKANNLEDIRKVSISQMELHSGPLPHPKILEGYKKIDKNAPKEIIEMAKREQKFRHSSTYFGQISALIIGIGGLTATTLLGIYGNAWVAGSIGFLSLGSLVGVFLYNSRSTKG